MYGKEWEPWKDKKATPCSDATFQDVELEKVRRGLEIRTDLIVIENETTAFTKARIGIKRHASIDWLEEEKSPAAATLYWMDTPVSLIEDERIVVRFTGCTLKDKLNVWGYGLLKRK